tara:strand:+ start:145 stop:453 length:309 start_codon:yes stop_codon:yes gene_type:complete
MKIELHNHQVEEVAKHWIRENISKMEKWVDAKDGILKARISIELGVGVELEVPIVDSVKEMIRLYSEDGACEGDLDRMQNAMHQLLESARLVKEWIDANPDR